MVIELYKRCIDERKGIGERQSIELISLKHRFSRSFRRYGRLTSSQNNW